MSIDLGNTPTGTPPTAGEQTQMRTALGALASTGGTATNLTLSGTLAFTSMDSGAALAIRNAAGLGVTAVPAFAGLESTTDGVNKLEISGPHLTTPGYVWPGFYRLSSCKIYANGANCMDIYNAAETARVGVTIASNGLMYIGNGTAGDFTGGLKLTQIILDKTITAALTTGAQTINKTSGSVNFAAAATSLVVTNSLVTANSVIQCTVATADGTMFAAQAVAGTGSFTIYPNVAPTAETRVNFTITN